MPLPKAKIMEKRKLTLRDPEQMLYTSQKLMNKKVTLVH